MAEQQDITQQDVSSASALVGDQLEEAPPADIDATPEPTKEEIEAQEAAFAKQATSYADGEPVEVGDIVRFRQTKVATPVFAPESEDLVSASPFANPTAEWKVVAVNDPRDYPGYAVGILAPSPFEGGHDLEGAAGDESTDVDVRAGVRYGRGWWALGSDLEKVDATA
jgi:hypothetical protein